MGRGAKRIFRWKAALAVLGPLCPRPLPFEETLALSVARLKGQGVPCPGDHDSRSQLAGFLLKVYTAGLVDFRAGLPPIAATPSARPVASPVARWEAQHRDFVTSLFHIAVKVEDEIGKNLLVWLDGSADRQVLLEKLWCFLESKNALVVPNGNLEAARRDLAAKLDENLTKLARMGLLIG